MSLRIAILTWRDSTHPEGGGSELFVEQVAGELAKKGHEVTIHCAEHPQAPPDEVVAGVRFRRRGHRLTVYPRGLLWAAVRRRDHDVVVDVINGLPFGSPLVRRRGVVALVHHVHDRQWRIIYPGVRGRIGWFIEGRITPALYRRVPFVTVSEASRRDLATLLGLDPGCITVVRNGLDAVPSTAPRSTTPRLCVLSRLVPHKRIEQAIDLVADLRDQFPDLHLDIVGEGWWHAQLESHAVIRGVRDHVTFHGHVRDDLRDDLLAQAWVMVLPSVREGWGIAVMEAAAQGTPTVAYREAGGVQESVVNGVTGTLVDDYVAMRAEIRRLLRSRDARETLGAAARARTEDFSWASTAAAVEDVVYAVSGRRR